MKLLKVYITQIYDSPESDLKLNDVFEFIGVLTLDSELNEDKDDHDEPDNGFCDDVMEHLPPIKVLNPCICKIVIWFHYLCCWLAPGYCPVRAHLAVFMFFFFPLPVILRGYFCCRYHASIALFTGS